MAGKIKLTEIENKLKDADVEFALEILNDLKNEYGDALDKLMSKFLKKRETLKQERERIYQMSKYERIAYAEGMRLVAGIDEVGRGPLAGPVVAAAVILPQDVFIEHINDSKKLSPQRREILYEEIREKSVSIGVGIIDERVIDEINILNATKLAMEQAVSQLKPQPDILLIDALKLENVVIKQQSIIKGDALSISIAAASIIAKVTRDRMLDEMNNKYPQYGFSENKGYGTEAHIKAIKKHGLCPIHRISFTKNFTC